MIQKRIEIFMGLVSYLSGMLSILYLNFRRRRFMQAIGRQAATFFIWSHGKITRSVDADENFSPFVILGGRIRLEPDIFGVAENKGKNNDFKNVYLIIR